MMDPLEGGPLLIESLQQILSFTGPTKKSFLRVDAPFRRESKMKIIELHFLKV